jgi:hypothetical protein
MGLQDLKEAFPDVGNGLQRLLEEEGDVESIYSHNFEVEYDHFGELRKVPLKPGGSQIPVTNDNRAEFVELYTKFKLYDSVKSNFDAFANGFVEVRTQLSSTPHRTPLPPTSNDLGQLENTASFLSRAINIY